ncbi:MAG: hypothetical protein OEZ01_06470 [Candidatus Heimdallarchaeota archaeon]|nr:hypothetical protein [Candidatus Heimdallarchaeota archaeon]
MSPQNYFSAKSRIGTCDIYCFDLSQAPTQSSSSDQVKLLLELMFDTISELQDIPNAKYFGYFWNTVSLISARSDDYINKLADKYDVKVDFFNYISKLNSIIVIVFKIFHEIVNYEKTLACFHCKDLFYNNGGLTRHIARYELPNHECQICNEKFYERYEFNRHQSVHS